MFIFLYVGLYFLYVGKFICLYTVNIIILNLNYNKAKIIKYEAPINLITPNLFKMAKNNNNSIHIFIIL